MTHSYAGDPSASSVGADAAAVGDYPVVGDIQHQDSYVRFLPLVKWLLLIPHWFALFFVFIGAIFAIVYAWFAVLITGKFPEGVHRFLVGTGRWATRATAYAFLMTDRYPPFSLDHDDDYPARYDVAYKQEIARWRPLVQWLLVYPYTLVASVLMFLAYVCTFLAFFAILFTKKFPQGLFDFNVVALRWQNRGNVYGAFMVDKYPPWEWG